VTSGLAPSLETLPHRMTPTEVARGWVVGEPVGDGSSVAAGGVIAGLEDAIRPALRRAPCVVEFSGGRDSSVVLAVAQRLAEREGLPHPVAFTHIYPGLPEADEDEWQQMVVAHLGVTEWVRHDALEEVDLLGPIAQASLRRWGVLWPPLAHTRRAELEVAKGGSLLSGEGGDEVLGARRLSPLPYMLARRQAWSWTNVRHVVFAASPGVLRWRRYARRFDDVDQFPWLTPEARHSFARDLARDAVREPLSWRRAVLEYPNVRPVWVAMQTLDLLAADADVVRVHPLLTGGFLGALGSAGGRWGFAGRTAAMQQLFAGLLPEAVLTRTSKCRFNRAVFGPHSRAFAQSWDGENVDVSVVDPVGLKDAWLSDEPHAMTYALLQACWLAAHG
jgi:hypothetical protein